MICALVLPAAPILALHASGIINWNSSRFDDLEIDVEMVAEWCAALDALAEEDCDTPSDTDRWLDACGECPGDDPPLDERLRAQAHGRTACEDWKLLRAHCAAGEAMTRSDALAFVEATRIDVESSFEVRSCRSAPADAEPSDTITFRAALLARIARGEHDAGDDDDSSD